MQPQDKIFVAGHNGLLGSAVIRHLESQGFENLVTRPRSELNLRDQRATIDFLRSESPDYIFMCAATVGGIQDNINRPAEFLLNNLEIQNNVIDGAFRAKTKKLLFVGSTCIYPRESTIPISENSLLTGPLEPTNEGYAIAKIAGIKLCEFYRRQHGCNFIAAIPTNLFGIGDHYDQTKSHLLPALIHKVHQAKQKGQQSLELWGSGKPLREFMLSDDCADALVFLMQSFNDAEPINVGTGIDHSVTNLAKLVMDVLGVELNIVFDHSKPDGMFRKLSDTTKLKSLGWKSRYEIKEGIQIAYQDYLRRFGG